jgi:meso-butanediol dehydrogenase / (S,S)-butanediol dehydrogenase / diacetyl reductase
LSVAGERDWASLTGGLSAGIALGVAGMAGGALLLYMGERFLSSAGFLLAVGLVSVAAGLWVGAPEGRAPASRRMAGRWMLAIVALVLASFVSTLWLAIPAFQVSPLGPPVAVVFLLAEPLYALGTLLGALEARRRARASLWRVAAAPGGAGVGGAGVAFPALLGAAVGVLVTANWLIPAFPPGPVLLGAALLLAAFGTVELTAGHAKEEPMEDRVVVVTGVGGRGQLGYAVASAFVAEGARVLVTGRTAEVEARAGELGKGVVAVVADVADPAGAESVIAEVRARWSRLDVLVNLAGGLTVQKAVAETAPEEWQREHESNVGTVFALTRASLPLLRESRGVVVNFASPAGERAMARLGAYSAAKAGVIALTRALALEEGEHGVRVNAVAPGLVDTVENQAAMADGASRSRPMVRREEVVAAVLFLASDAASGVNGEVLRVLGGRPS